MLGILLIFGLTVIGAVVSAAFAKPGSWSQLSPIWGNTRRGISQPFQMVKVTSEAAATLERLNGPRQTD